MKMILRLASYMIKNPRAALRSMFIIINNMYCIPTYLILMLFLLPIKFFNYKLYYRIEGLLFHWLLANVSMWSWMAGYDLVESGDDIEVCMNKRTLVIANHQSTGDVPLLMAAFNARKGILPNIMWIMDKLFKYTNFGAVSIVHRDYFITSGKSSRTDTLDQLKKHMMNTYIPLDRKWIVLFPEGGFLHKRMTVSKRFAEKNNLRDLHNVTIPRVGALQAIFEVLSHPMKLEMINHNNNAGDGTWNANEIVSASNPEKSDELTVKNRKTHPKTTHSSENIHETDIEYILDITIGYQGKYPIDLLQILNGLRGPCFTNLYYRIYECKNLPVNDSELLTNWLYQRWYEKEELLNTFYETGSFPLTLNQKQPTLIHQDRLRFIIIHIFFLTFTYINFRCLYLLWNYMMTFFS